MPPSEYNPSAASGLNPGNLVGPYELIRLLGAGGMAEVWLARRADGAFKRDVALKLPLLTRRRNDLERRFAQERDILASLEHPHIARLYDAGIDAEGLPYLSMEYVKGEALMRWCDGAALSIARRLALFLQILDAVRYAHEKHVIHRDLKPSNIFVTDAGQVRLLDFGVAKLLQEDDEETQISRIYGQVLTPDYASPELLRAEPADARSDVYSLGIVLYELLSGARPYRVSPKATLEGMRQAVAHAEVQRPSAQLTNEASAARSARLPNLARALRGDLDAIVLKAMAKDPDERYDSAASMTEDLERHLRGQAVRARKTSLSDRMGKFLRRNRATTWFVAASLAALCAAVAVDHFLLPRPEEMDGKGPFSPPPHSVAVLPFTNLSGDPQQDYFSDGISEELINALSHIAALQVSAHTSSFSFKHKNADIATIARKLNVAAILEGSIRRSGDTVRITAQLVDTATGYHIWSQNFDRDLSDMLALQTDIATNVAKELQVKLLGSEAASIEAGGTRNAQAYDAYLRGLQIEVTAQDLAASREALADFDRAIALDPAYAAAYTHRVRALRGVANFTNDAAVVARLYADARLAAERAVALAPEDADAHMALGYQVLVYGYLEFAAAQSEIGRAVALAPGSATVLDSYAGFEGIIGHHEAALTAMRHAILLDPQNPRYREHLLQNLIWARRIREVLVDARDAKALHAEGYYAGILSAISYLALGRPDQASRICESAATPLDEADRHFCLAIADHELGRPEAASLQLSKYRTLSGDLGAVGYAAVYAQWGDKERALEWLATAERVRRASLATIKVDWMFDPLRGDPRFQALEQRLNFPP